MFCNSLFAFHHRSVGWSTYRNLFFVMEDDLQKAFITNKISRIPDGGQSHPPVSERLSRGLKLKGRQLTSLIRPFLCPTLVPRYGGQSYRKFITEYPSYRGPFSLWVLTETNSLSQEMTQSSNQRYAATSLKLHRKPFSLP